MLLIWPVQSQWQDGGGQDGGGNHVTECGT